MAEQELFDSDEARLEAFENQVKERMKELSRSADARVRRKAAAWLGEAGDPQAITSLRLAYEKDDDARVRAAARYALGMFRALEAKLDEDEDGALELLRAVQIEGRFGRRARPSVRNLVKAGFALLISAGLVALLALVLPDALRRTGPAPAPAQAAPSDTAPAEPTPTAETAPGEAAPTDIPAAASPVPDTVRVDAVQLQNIIETLAGPRSANDILISYWTKAPQGDTAGCFEPDPFIPADYALSPEAAAAAPDLQLATELVNTGLQGVRAGWAAFRQACDSGTLGMESQTWLPRAQAAAEAFRSAGDLLRKVLAGG